MVKISERLSKSELSTVSKVMNETRSYLNYRKAMAEQRMLGQFLQGVPPKQVGARLINVAVSRAKNHLIVLANLTYLDRLLPSASLLRGILYDMQRKWLRRFRRDFSNYDLLKAIFGDYLIAFR